MDQTAPIENRRSGKARKRGRDTREKIKATAVRLLITRGIRGFSYADIADQLDITTTNIHHHFGHKAHLIDEVVREYVVDASARHRAIWTDADLTLTKKIEKFVAFNFERYSKFNRGKKQGQPWSLIGRLRLDTQHLSAGSIDALASFGTDVQSFITTAVVQARDAGELRKDAPTKDIALILANMVNSTAIFTVVAGTFKVVREFFDSATRVILSGYGTARNTRSKPRRP